MAWTDFQQLFLREVGGGGVIVRSIFPCHELAQIGLVGLTEGTALTGHRSEDSGFILLSISVLILPKMAKSDFWLDRVGGVSHGINMGGTHFASWRGQKFCHMLFPSKYEIRPGSKLFKRVSEARFVQSFPLYRGDIVIVVL